MFSLLLLGNLSPLPYKRVISLVDRDNIGMCSTGIDRLLPGHNRRKGAKTLRISPCLPFHLANLSYDFLSSNHTKMT